MRVLEALKILEDAVLDCKKRDIDTPEVRAALELLDPQCSPKWYIQGFRNSLRPAGGQSGAELDGQQQVLRVYFAGIYRCIRTLLHGEIGRLGAKYARSKDETVKAEIACLTAELAKLPARWVFYVRKD